MSYIYDIFHHNCSVNHKPSYTITLVDWASVILTSIDRRNHQTLVYLSTWFKSGSVRWINSWQEWDKNQCSGDNYARINMGLQIRQTMLILLIGGHCQSINHVLRNDLTSFEETVNTVWVKICAMENMCGFNDTNIFFQTKWRMALSSSAHLTFDNALTSQRSKSWREISRYVRDRRDVCFGSIVQTSRRSRNCPRNIRKAFSFETFVLASSELTTQRSHPFSEMFASRSRWKGCVFSTVVYVHVCQYFLESLKKRVYLAFRKFYLAWRKGFRFGPDN